MALTGCASSTGSGEPPRLEPINALLMQGCARPVRIPDRQLAGGDIARLWAQDRGALATCADRQQRLVDAITDRDARLSMTKGR